MIKKNLYSIYGEEFNPYGFYSVGKSLVDVRIPPEELGIGALVGDFEARINPMSFDNQVYLSVGKDFQDFFKMVGYVSIKLLDGFSKAVKNIHEQGYFHNRV